METNDIRPMNIAVVGAGGTGSYIIPVLCKVFKESTIIVLDGDTLEPHNLDRQLFSPDDIGMNKAEAIAMRYPECRISPVRSYFSLSSDIPDLDLIVSCADNHPTRVEVLQHADRTGCWAVVCGNEYTYADSWAYNRDWRGTPNDMRVRFPELLQDRSGDPRITGCTGQAQEENRQLAIANFASADHALRLIWFWLVEWEKLKETTKITDCPIGFHSSESGVIREKVSE